LFARINFTSGILGLTARWAHYASETTYERLPSDIVCTLKGLILDTLGTALAGSTLGDCAREVAGFVRATAGTPQATLIGHDTRVGVLAAAFANGAFAHSLNYDASGPLGGHIGVAAVPAPLVMAERQGAVSGKELLAAVAVAADFTARLAGALTVAQVDANEKFLEGQVLGYFGAAVGAGRVMRFDAAQMHSALGIALMQTAGTRQPSLEGRAAKAIYGGYANHGAVMSALLAEQNIDAQCAAIEGPAGLFALFYGSRFDEPTISDGLGSDFRMLDIRFKPWPTSNRLHPFIRAAIELRERHQITAADIASVHVEAAPLSKAWLEPRAERQRPHNAATAANSIFFGVAKALANGNVTLADVTAVGLEQREALDIAAVTGYTLNPDLSRNEAVVSVGLKNGGAVTARVGHERREMSYEQLVTKFLDCAGYAAKPVSHERHLELAERIEHLEGVPDVAELLALLSKDASRR
jgi:2-methylcitrate dehydratase PrpD